jgi:pimeloyl-ACP methyl ester carboxylesterase
VRLAGTLLSPRGDGPFPAVVLMHGSNPGERDFYRLYADRFARVGIAALVYDRRGSGASTGNPDSTLDLRARDAAAAVRWLRQQPNIDPGAVGLWAFSNGTWSAVQVAAGIEPVAFMVVTGAAGVSGAESEIHRKVTELHGWGVEPALLDDVATAWRTAYACLAGGQWPAGVSDAAYEALVSRLHAAASLQAVPLSAYAARNPWLAPIPPEVSAAELRRFAGHVSDLAYDPAEDYARIRCPVLFLVGEHDPNTPSAAAARIREVLERAGNTRSKADVVPGAGHYINITPDSIEGMAAAEAASQLHGLRFVPGYLDRVPAWVRAVTGR